MTTESKEPPHLRVDPDQLHQPLLLNLSNCNSAGTGTDAAADAYGSKVNKLLLPGLGSGGASFLQTLLNAINVLAGVGIVSTPYAAAQGGWLGLAFLLLVAVACFYTAVLLRRCLDADATLQSYPDIGKAAFGRAGQWIVSAVLYSDLFLVAVEFLILEGDHLAEIFPVDPVPVGASLTLAPRALFILAAALVMLPTVWLRDLTSLAYVSAGGAAACVAIVGAVAWVGAVDGVGFHHRGRALNLPGLPLAVGVYAFCYCGHAVVPNIYRSMSDRSHFNIVVGIAFAVCTLLYGSIAVVGYLMFGDDTRSQVTLNLPRQYVASNVAVWITLVNPLAKFALLLLPICRAVEHVIVTPSTSSSSSEGEGPHVDLLRGTALRTAVVACTVAVALLLPAHVFGYLMAFIGSFLSVTTAVLVPCVCYLKLRPVPAGDMDPEFFLVHALLCAGVVGAVAGTYASILGMSDS